MDLWYQMAESERSGQVVEADLNAGMLRIARAQTPSQEQVWNGAKEM
ncbi:MAG: hypothetical protein V3W19_06675 [Desulfatiglandales bacterium]